MDKELTNLTLNISQLAALSDVHRQTVTARLKNVATSGGNESNLKLYKLTSVFSELMKMPTPVSGDDMAPQDRKAWYQSERERLKFEQEIGELLPASDVAREMASMAKAMIQGLETLPDILERDCAMTPSAVLRVQNIIDDMRDQIAQKVADADTSMPEEGEPEEA